MGGRRQVHERGEQRHGWHGTQAFETSMTSFGDGDRLDRVGHLGTDRDEVQPEDRTCRPTSMLWQLSAATSVPRRANTRQVHGAAPPANAVKYQVDLR